MRCPLTSPISATMASATYSAGTKSAQRPCEASSSAVAGPMAHRRVLAKARASRSIACKRDHTALTPLTLVKMIQSYWRLNASSSRAVSCTGSIWITGNSIGSAPNVLKSKDNSLACSRARVTRMRLPNNRRASNQASFSRSVTTWPMTNTAGGSSRWLRSTISPSVPTTVSCWEVVPQRITAASVSNA